MTKFSFLGELTL